MILRVYSSDADRMRLATVIEARRDGKLCPFIIHQNKYIIQKSNGT